MRGFSAPSRLMTLARGGDLLMGSVLPDNMLLPRLCYIGDVPIEASYHGSALLYRLLRNYPAERLCVVEAGICASLPERRLTGVKYHYCAPPLKRLQTTRLAEWYAAACLLASTSRVGAFRTVAAEFKPEAVLTVTHGYSWITGMKVAQSLGVPIHLICHDEWTATVRTLKALDGWKSGVFGKYYRAAHSRLCVSPFMVEKYQQRYHAPGAVLYPSRAADAQRFTGPPERLACNTENFTCAFAGTINSAGMVEALKLLAESLRSLGGRLLIFGPLLRAQAETWGLIAPNVVLRGLLSSADLMNELRESADTLLVPISFCKGDRANVEINFPSKLTDYTAVGLPLLIYGPSYSSAVQWARQNPGVAEIVEMQNSEALRRALLNIKNNTIYRLQLGKNALDVGDTYFSNEAASRILRRCLALNQSRAQGHVLQKQGG
jgi:glycosyltransferase involved in cell wall biosynthesis